MRRTFVIGFMMVMFVAIICALYASRMIHRGFSTRTAPSSIESSLAMTIRDMAIPSRYEAMKNPVAVTPEVIHDGMAHWADHCATCHANNGSGDTMYARTMYPRPPDMLQKDTHDIADAEL